MKSIMTTAAAAALALSPALAQQQNTDQADRMNQQQGAEQQQKDAMSGKAKAKAKPGSSELLKKSRKGAELSDTAISGQELVNADLTRAVEPIASVTDVILNEEGEIIYLAYETTRVRDLDEEGYYAVGDIKLDDTPGFGFDVETTDITKESAPEKVKLTAREAQGQMLSNILRGRIRTDDGTYDIRDVAFTPDGQAEYLIVGKTSGGFLREGDAFAIPFSDAEFKEGIWQTKTAMGDMDELNFASND